MSCIIYLLGLSEFLPLIFDILSLIFDNLVVTCLSAILSGLNLIGDLCPSYPCVMVSISKIEKFSSVVSINMLSSPFKKKNSSPHETRIMQKFCRIMVSHNSYWPSSFLNRIFPFAS